MCACAIRVLCAITVLAFVPSGVSAQRSSVSPDQSNPPTVQEQDLFLGTWELDLTRSSFMPGPPPRSEIRSYQDEHEGIKAEILTTNADGSRTHMEYVASYNDVVAVVTGTGRTDALRMRRVDPFTAETQLSYAGQVVGRARREISRDGLTLTITLDRTAPMVVHNVEVYKRIGQ